MSRRITATSGPRACGDDAKRKEMLVADREAFDRLKAELKQAFEEPNSFYWPLTAAEVIARNEV